MGADEAEVRAALERHWEYGGTDQDIAHEIYHDDAVLEFPQSGERFEGVDNFREWRRQYPAKLAFEIRRIRGQGDLWVAENSISYDDGAVEPDGEHPGVPRRQGCAGVGLRHAAVGRARLARTVESGAVADARPA